MLGTNVQSQQARMESNRSASADKGLSRVAFLLRSDGDVAQLAGTNSFMTRKSLKIHETRLWHGPCFMCRCSPGHASSTNLKPECPCPDLTNKNVDRGIEPGGASRTAGLLFFWGSALQKKSPYPLTLPMKCLPLPPKPAQQKPLSAGRFSINPESPHRRPG
ncbi:MAG: hypothetical protein ACI8RZ_005494 [Myxococcota bacterium]|jgi:hypothetical protein